MIKAHLAGIAFATIFGVTFLFSKVALEFLTPFGLLSIRFTLAWIVMHLLWKAKLIRFNMSSHIMKQALGVVVAQPIVYFTFEIIGLTLIPSSVAGIMIALIPLITFTLSSLLSKHGFTWRKLMWMLVSFCGVLWLSALNAQVESVNASWLGIGLVLIAVVAAAVFNIVSKKTTQHMSVLSLTYVMMMSGAIFFTLAHGIEVVLFEMELNVITWITYPQLSGALIYLGLVASIGGFFLVNYALSILSASSASVYANLATVVSIIVGVVFLAEAFTLYHGFASLMIIIGVRQSVLIA